MADVKVTKKDIQQAKQPDAVLEAGSSLFDWILERRGLLLGALALLIVVVAGVQWASASSEKKSRELGEKLSTAVQLAGRPVIERKPGETTPAGTESFGSKAEKQKAQEDALTAVVQASPDSEAARSAQLQLAALRMEQGKYDDAIGAYEKFAGDPKAGALKLFALEGLGYAYEAKGDAGKAEEQFKKLSDAGAPALALYHQARLAEKAGKKDDARKLYEQVAKDYEKESVAAEARTRLELLDAPPAGQGAIEAAAPAPAPEPAAPKKGAKKKTP